MHQNFSLAHFDVKLVLNAFLSHQIQLEIKEDMPVLTDDYAPVEYYANRLMAAYLALFKN